MQLIESSIAKLQGILDDLPLLIREVINENHTLIEDMILAQLEKGQRGDGTSLPNYSPVSVKVYGKPPGPIKLYDTGAFYRAVFAKAFDDAFQIGDTDPKTPGLTTLYGDAILQLSDEHKAELVNDILKSELVSKIKQRLA